MHNSFPESYSVQHRYLHEDPDLQLHSCKTRLDRVVPSDASHHDGDYHLLCRIHPPCRAASTPPRLCSRRPADPFSTAPASGSPTSSARTTKSPPSLPSCLDTALLQTFPPAPAARPHPAAPAAPPPGSAPAAPARHQPHAVPGYGAERDPAAAAAAAAASVDPFHFDWPYWDLPSARPPALL